MTLVVARCQISLLEWRFKEEVYVKQPFGFLVGKVKEDNLQIKEGFVWSIDGTSCLEWEEVFSERIDFTHYFAELNLYIYKKCRLVIVIVYVDDLMTIDNQTLYLNATKVGL